MLQDALTKLGETDDPDRSAFEVVRALDAYLDAAAPRTVAPLTPPAGSAESDRQDRRQVKGATVLVLGTALAATIVVAVAMNGGWPAGIAIAAIWVAAFLLFLVGG